MSYGVFASFADIKECILTQDWSDNDEDPSDAETLGSSSDDEDERQYVASGSSSQVSSTYGSSNSLVAVTPTRRKPYLSSGRSFDDSDDSQSNSKVTPTRRKLLPYHSSGRSFDDSDDSQSDSKVTPSGRKLVSYHSSGCSFDDSEDNHSDSTVTPTQRKLLPYHSNECSLDDPADSQSDSNTELYYPAAQQKAGTPPSSKARQRESETGHKRAATSISEGDIPSDGESEDIVLLEESDGGSSFASAGSKLSVKDLMGVSHDGGEVVLTDSAQSGHDSPRDKRPGRDICNDTFVVSSPSDVHKKSCSKKAANSSLSADEMNPVVILRRVVPVPVLDSEVTCDERFLSPPPKKECFTRVPLPKMQIINSPYRVACPVPKNSPQHARLCQENNKQGHHAFEAPITPPLVRPTASLRQLHSSGYNTPPVRRYSPALQHQLTPKMKPAVAGGSYVSPFSNLSSDQLMEYLTSPQARLHSLPATSPIALRRGPQHMESGSPSSREACPNEEDGGRLSSEHSSRGSSIQRKGQVGIAKCKQYHSSKCNSPKVPCETQHQGHQRAVGSDDSGPLEQTSPHGSGDYVHCRKSSKVQTSPCKTKHNIALPEGHTSSWLSKTPSSSKCCRAPTINVSPVNNLHKEMMFTPCNSVDTCSERSVTGTLSQRNIQEIIGRLVYTTEGKEKCRVYPERRNSIRKQHQESSGKAAAVYPKSRKKLILTHTDSDDNHGCDIIDDKHDYDYDETGSSKQQETKEFTGRKGYKPKQDMTTDQSSPHRQHVLVRRKYIRSRGSRGSPPTTSRHSDSSLSDHTDASEHSAQSEAPEENSHEHSPDEHLHDKQPLLTARCQSPRENNARKQSRNSRTFPPNRQDEYEHLEPVIGHSPRAHCRNSGSKLQKFLLLQERHRKESLHGDHVTSVARSSQTTNQGSSEPRKPASLSKGCPIGSGQSPARHPVSNVGKDVDRNSRSAHSDKEAVASRTLRDKSSDSISLVQPSPGAYRKSSVQPSSGAYRNSPVQSSLGAYRDSPVQSSTGACRDTPGACRKRKRSMISPKQLHLHYDHHEEGSDDVQTKDRITETAQRNDRTSVSKYPASPTLREPITCAASCSTPQKKSQQMMAVDISCIPVIRMPGDEPHKSPSQSPPPSPTHCVTKSPTHHRTAISDVSSDSFEMERSPDRTINTTPSRRSRKTLTPGNKSVQSRTKNKETPRHKHLNSSNIAGISILSKMQRVNEWIKQHRHRTVPVRHEESRMLSNEMKQKAKKVYEFTSSSISELAVPFSSLDSQSDSESECEIITVSETGSVDEEETKRIANREDLEQPVKRRRHSDKLKPVIFKPLSGLTSKKSSLSIRDNSKKISRPHTCSKKDQPSDLSLNSTMSVCLGEGLCKKTFCFECATRY